MTRETETETGEAREKVRDGAGEGKKKEREREREWGERGRVTRGANAEEKVCVHRNIERVDPDAPAPSISAEK